MLRDSPNLVPKMLSPDLVESSLFFQTDDSWHNKPMELKRSTFSRVMYFSFLFPSFFVNLLTSGHCFWVML